MNGPQAHLIAPAGIPQVYVFLSPVPGEPGPLYLVMICPHNARLARLRDHHGPVLGGISKTHAGWAAVAYADRNHFLQNTGHSAFLNDVDDPADAVAQLIQHWRKAPSTRRKIAAS